MDADEIFHQNRKEYVKSCIFTKTKHLSRFDNHELDGERSDCGKDLPKWKLYVHQIPRH